MSKDFMCPQCKGKQTVYNYQVYCPDCGYKIKVDYEELEQKNTNLQQKNTNLIDFCEELIDYFDDILYENLHIFQNYNEIENKITQSKQKLKELTPDFTQKTSKKD